MSWDSRACSWRWTSTLPRRANQPQTLGKSALGHYARLKRIPGRRWQGAIRYSSGRHPTRHITSPGAGIGPLARALCWSITVHPMRTPKRHRHNYATSFIVAVVPKGVCALPHAAPSHQFVRRSADRCSGHLSCAGDGERRLPIGSGLCANALSTCAHLRTKVSCRLRIASPSGARRELKAVCALPHRRQGVLTPNLRIQCSPVAHGGWQLARRLPHALNPRRFNPSDPTESVKYESGAE